MAVSSCCSQAMWAAIRSTTFGSRAWGFAMLLKCAARGSIPPDYVGTFDGSVAKTARGLSAAHCWEMSGVETEQPSDKAHLGPAADRFDPEAELALSEHPHQLKTGDRRPR